MSAAVAEKLDIAWQPFPGGQQLFLSCPLWELLGEGDRGGGKTETLLMDFCQHVGQGFGSWWAGILFRREYKHLDDLVKKSQRLIPLIFPDARWIKSDYTWHFPDGETLSLRVMSDPEDYWDYHGHEYPWIGWEELTNWPNEDCYERMKSCSRSSRPGMPRKLRSTCNPWGAGHGWVKARFIEPAPRGTPIYDAGGEARVALHMPRKQNRALLEADPDYERRLASIKNKALREAWLSGSWDIAIGGFLSDVWDPDVHIVKPFNIPPDWTRWRSMDWGYASPYSIGWYAMNPDRQIFLYRELCGVDTDHEGKLRPNVGVKESATDVARKILAMEAAETRVGIQFKRNPADTNIWHSDGREVTQAQLFAQKHTVKVRGRTITGRVQWVPASKGPQSRKATAQLVVNELAERRLFFFNSCTNHLRTIPVLMPDPDDWEDVDTDMEDHDWDQLRYSIASRHQPKRPKAPPRSPHPDPVTADYFFKD